MRYITLLLISFLLTTSAHTQESNEGSIITGRAAVLEGDTIEINGQKIRLHGQKQKYLEIQLEKFRSKKRTHNLMSVIGKNLSDDQLKELAKYYSQGAR